MCQDRTKNKFPKPLLVSEKESNNKWVVNIHGSVNGVGKGFYLGYSGQEKPLEDRDAGAEM